VNVAFLAHDLQLSGGMGVVVHHARRLAAHHGIDTALVLVREQEKPHWDFEHLEHLEVLSFDEARARRFDVAVSTWWETVFALFELRAERYASFVQSLEDRFYPPGHADRVGAALALDLPVSFITEARWIAESLAELRPDAPCRLVRNGIDKTIHPADTDVTPSLDGPLRVLVEGSATVWFKGVNEAIEAAHAMAEPYELTVVSGSRDGLVTSGADRVVGPLSQRDLAALYGQTDVVLKLSRVEGMYGPPLEGFHHGTTVVTTPVTGHEEYVEHGHNGLIVDWDDPVGTAHALDLLARDRRLLHELRTNALETARRWPSWEHQGQIMAAALRAIRADPPPDPYAHAGRHGAQPPGARGGGEPLPARAPDRGAQADSRRAADAAGQEHAGGAGGREAAEARDREVVAGVRWSP
jgi:O-antigen biosynthesis protein